MDLCHKDLPASPLPAAAQKPSTIPGAVAEARVWSRKVCSCSSLQEVFRGQGGKLDDRQDTQGLQVVTLTFHLTENTSRHHYLKSPKPCAAHRSLQTASRYSHRSPPLAAPHPASRCTPETRTMAHLPSTAPTTRAARLTHANTVLAPTAPTPLTPTAPHPAHGLAATMCREPGGQRAPRLPVAPRSSPPRLLCHPGCSQFLPTEELCSMKKQAPPS